MRSLPAVGLSLLLSAPALAQDVTGEQVRAAIEKGRRYLLHMQGANGRWSDYAMPGGTTALATLALLNAGVPPDDPPMQRALGAVREIPLQYTYVVSLEIQALVAANPRKYRDEIARAADWLTRAQQANGMWGYGLEGARTDFSNSQFALLGLHEAARGGARVNNVVWTRARVAYVNSQNPDGGWGYMPMYPQNTGSMTAAGVASLYICGNSVAMARPRGKASDGSIVCCQPYIEYRPIARGLRWLAQHFSVRRNPNSGSYYYYYMYGLERVGILSGLRHIGEHDWYREGAAQLVARQHGDGSWRELDDIVDTAFALLFLAKGHKPILVNKLQWSNDANAWNLTRNDLPHLLAFIGDKLGEPMSWEAVPLSADLAVWMTAPILYFNGQDFPRFKPDDVERLREYIRQGGTILACATCDLPGFRKGFEDFVKAAFPDDPLIRLAPEHPVFNAVYQLDGTKLDLRGLSTGCRTSVLFSPRDIACLWDAANIPNESEEAFRLGTNIAAYATGLEPLPDKLDAVRLAEAAGDAPAAAAPARGAVHLAQIMHNGDWRPNPKSIPRLADYLHRQLAVDVVPSAEPLALTDAKLAQHPILYMAGHYSFGLKPDEIDALRRHLERGGFLLANACCGRQAFDTSFRELAQRLFPDDPLEKLPAAHPIIAGEPGVPLPVIQYRQALRVEQPNLNAVQLEGITLDDRLVVVYSRYSLDCGLDGHKCFACRGIEHDDALRLAGNVILYALSY
ncbi:MAG: DUF4159 domain-containing protein [Planctomycetes bacterium]|nr:DUF4159 domain-containing protein [Planctomycetota bacterium]